MIHLSVGRLCAGWQIDVRSLYNAYQRLLALPVDVTPHELTYSHVRALELRHLLALQSFPSSFRVRGGRAFQGVAAGNAMPPVFAHAVGLGIARVLRQIEAASQQTRSSVSSAAGESLSTCKLASAAGASADRARRTRCCTSSGSPRSDRGKNERGGGRKNKGLPCTTAAVRAAAAARAAHGSDHPADATIKSHVVSAVRLVRTCGAVDRLRPAARLVLRASHGPLHEQPSRCTVLTLGGHGGAASRGGVRGRAAACGPAGALWAWRGRWGLALGGGPGGAPRRPRACVHAPGRTMGAPGRAAGAGEGPGGFS